MLQFSSVVQFIMHQFFTNDVFKPTKTYNQLTPEQAAQLAEKAKLGASLLDYCWKYNTQTNADLLQAPVFEQLWNLKLMHLDVVN